MTQQQLYEEIIQGLKQLPQDKVLEVRDFVEFLNIQNKKHSELFQQQKYQTENKKIVKLKGLWKGFEPTDEEIQQARKEIWKHLDTKEIL
jgi:hypothetical protein